MVMGSVCGCVRMRRGALSGWRTEIGDLRSPELPAVRCDDFRAPAVAEQAERINAVVLRKGGNLVSPMERMSSKSVHEHDGNAFVAGVDIVDFERSRACLCSCPSPLVPALLPELHALSALGIYFIIDCGSDWLLVIN